MFAKHDLIWRGNDLGVGRSSTPLVSIVPDTRWPNMWRVRHGDQLSDMVNLTRARDAGRCLALSMLNDRGRTGLGASPIEKTGESPITTPDAASHELRADNPVGDRTGLAAVGQIEKAKGGRGKRGGISEAARQAGVSRFAAMRAAKRVRQP
jgi:hypothetical protein